MKVTIVGAGNVGATAADVIASKGIADQVVLLDIKEGFAEGKALDLMQTATTKGFDSIITGTTGDYSLTKDSDVVVITSGIPRKPGMTREELIGINANIVKDVSSSILKYNTEPIIVMVSNPMDTMTYLSLKSTGLNPKKVIGMGGALDSSRFKLFLSEEFSVPVKEIEAMVMGGHGDTMVPLPRFTKVSGKPLLDLVKEGKISQKRLEEINQRTRDGGAEIVKFLEKGSAFYAPAASGVEMAKAYLRDEKKMLPCAAYLNGEYGIKDIYAGVPIIVGKNGVEKIEEINLDEKEKSEFLHSIDAVKKLWEAASKIDPDLNK